MDLQERIEQLEGQLKQTEALYMKLQGGIEVLKSMKEEKSVVKDEKK